MPPEMYKFKVGDEVIVTGDNAEWLHELEPGDTGTITTVHPYGYGDKEYRTGVREPGYRIERPSPWDWYVRDVAECDLKLAFEPVTEEELAETYKSLGYTEPNSL